MRAIPRVHLANCLPISSLAAFDPLTSHSTARGQRHQHEASRGSERRTKMSGNRLNVVSDTERGGKNRKVR